MNRNALMIQGTTSDAGKSTVVAGLGRVFVRRGIAVVPFKPQNMALNSAVTANGGEIGRAQAVQAQACRLEPSTDMNPVLIKPSSDTGAQIIVNGQVQSQMTARDYHHYKSIAKDAVLAAYARLEQQYDLVLVEGAGSPAEINLRDRDIANMGFAEAVDCPVLLVADIDRGGVFAHIVGTLALLSESEQRRTVGSIINRFRGDFSLLQPGIDWLERKVNKPVLATLPYLQGFHLDAEDGLDRRVMLAQTTSKLSVLVPALPRISNHTDFDALRLHPQVEFRYVGPGEQWPGVDLVILPGSKNVRGDLDWFRAQGWDKALAKHLRWGGKVIGICGGYQMLGRRICDPYAVEGCAGESQGLGVLAIDTVLERHKQLNNVRGTLFLNSAPVQGYEIHMGVSSPVGESVPVVTDIAERFNEVDAALERRDQYQLPKNKDNRVDGTVDSSDQVFGCYIHGLFDHPRALSEILHWSGLGQVVDFDIRDFKEKQIDRLADCIEAHMDIERLREWIDFK